MLSDADQEKAAIATSLLLMQSLVEVKLAKRENCLFGEKDISSFPVMGLRQTKAVYRKSVRTV